MSGTPDAELPDSLSLAFLVVLERLAPVERAVFLLHDVFGFDYPRIAGIVGKSEVNCRQIASRARRYVDARRPRFDVSPEERAALAERFFTAVDTGDLGGLVELLAADAVAYGDGGGRGPSLPKPVAGRDRVLRLLAALTATIRRFDLHLDRGAVNGQPGALVRDASGSLLNVLSVDVLSGQVQRTWRRWPARTIRCAAARAGDLAPGSDRRGSLSQPGTDLVLEGDSG